MADAEHFYRLADGGLIARTVSGPGVADLAIPKGATRLSKSAYERALSDVRGKQAAHADEVRAADDATRRGDYEALVALHVPEGTARRLTGYTGGA